MNILKGTMVRILDDYRGNYSHIYKGNPTGICIENVVDGSVKVAFIRSHKIADVDITHIKIAEGLLEHYKKHDKVVVIDVKGSLRNYYTGKPLVKLGSVGEVINGDNPAAIQVKFKGDMFPYQVVYTEIEPLLEVLE